MEVVCFENNSLVFFLFVFFAMIKMLDLTLVPFYLFGFFHVRTQNDKLTKACLGREKTDIAYVYTANYVSLCSIF